MAVVKLPKGWSDILPRDDDSKPTAGSVKKLTVDLLDFALRSAETKLDLVW